MSRLLQDHHGVQSRPDCCAVCRLFHRPVSAHRRESSPHRRMLLQEETTLSRVDLDAKTNLDGHEIPLPRPPLPST